MVTRSSAPRTSTPCEAFEDDPDTKAIVMIGEIGGDAEERAADYIKDERVQAGRRLRRGLHRARGQDDGPRRRHRVRLVGHRGQPRRRPWRPPASQVGKTPSETARLAREILRPVGAWREIDVAPQIVAQRASVRASNWVTATD